LAFGLWDSVPEHLFADYVVMVVIIAHENLLLDCRVMQEHSSPAGSQLWGNSRSEATPVSRFHIADANRLH
jgi:hypothetical protein